MKPIKQALFALLILSVSASPAIAAPDSTNVFTVINSASFQGGKLLAKPGKAGLADILLNQRARNRGVIAAARMAFSVNPTANDTIAIGSSTFKYVGVLGAAVAQTQILIGGNAAASLASTLNAINGVTDATVVPATTPFAGSIVADAVTATVLRIQTANVQGGTAVPAVPSTTTLTASISGGASAWSIANLTAAGGKVLADQDISSGILTITAAMVTAGAFDVELPFTPTAVLWSGYASTGVLRSVNEAVTISGSAIHLALAGGGSPNWQAGDTFRFEAIK
jgi:hypothetical protein